MNTSAPQSTEKGMTVEQFRKLVDSNATDEEVWSEIDKIKTQVTEELDQFLAALAKRPELEARFSAELTISRA